MANYKVPVKGGSNNWLKNAQRNSMNAVKSGPVYAGAGLMKAGNVLKSIAGMAEDVSSAVNEYNIRKDMKELADMTPFITGEDGLPQWNEAYEKKVMEIAPKLDRPTPFMQSIWKMKSDFMRSRAKLAEKDAADYDRLALIYNVPPEEIPKYIQKRQRILGGKETIPQGDVSEPATLGKPAKKDLSPYEMKKKTDINAAVEKTKAVEEVKQKIGEPIKKKEREEALISGIVKDYKKRLQSEKDMLTDPSILRLPDEERAQEEAKIRSRIQETSKALFNAEWGRRFDNQVTGKELKERADAQYLLDLAKDAYGMPNATTLDILKVLRQEGLLLVPNK